MRRRIKLLVTQREDEALKTKGLDDRERGHNGPGRLSCLGLLGPGRSEVHLNGRH